jgi:hypothetical protein
MIQSSPARHPLPVFDPAIWTGFTLVTAFDAVAIWSLGWTVVWRPLLVVALGVGMLLGLAGLYRRRAPEVARWAAPMAFILGAAAVALVAVYVATLTRFPLRDAELAAMDHALGFHWDPVANWVCSHPTVAAILGAAYSGLLLQSVLTVAVLAWWRPARLRPFLRRWALIVVRGHHGAYEIVQLAETSFT